MLPDDVYRSRLQATIEGLRYWIPTVADVAHVSEREGDRFWKMSVTPAAANACPFELVLRTDQCHDLVIGGETFEDLPTKSLDAFVPLVEAIAEGRVMQCHWTSAATGTQTAVETIVTLSDGREWSSARMLTPLASDNPDAVIASARHFVPYRRR